MEGRTERIKNVIRYLVGKGVASNQLDLGIFWQFEYLPLF